MKRIRISTDGALKSNSGVGGWAVVIRQGDDVLEKSGQVRDTTNQRMELRPILEGLQEMSDGEAVLVRSDSKYALGVAFEGNKVRANEDLIEAIWDEIERLDVEWEKVKAHVGDPDNERADDLAKDEMLTLHEEITDGDPFIVRGDVTGDEASDVKEVLKGNGLRWDFDKFAWVTWDRETWKKATEEVGAEIESEGEAVR